MPVRLYALLTWTTLRRLPLIHAGAGAFLHRVLPEIARRHGTRLIALGIVRNHVHTWFWSSRPRSTFHDSFKG